MYICGLEKDENLFLVSNAILPRSCFHFVGSGVKLSEQVHGSVCGSAEPLPLIKCFLTNRA